MQNRHKVKKPEVYVDLPPIRYGEQTIPDKPVPLDVFEVTYVHYHRYLELGYCVSGEGMSYLEDRTEPFNTGDILIVFPFQRHISCNSTQDFSLWDWAYIDLLSIFSQSGVGDVAHLTDIVQNEMGLCGILDQKKYPEVARQAKRLLEEMKSGMTSRHGQERFALDVYSFLLMLSEASEPLPKLSMRNDQKLMLVRPALDHINASLDKEIIPSVSQLSEMCSLSQTYFRRVFGEVVGVSPKEYIAMTCMRKATLLLSLTELKVMEIAMHCGYQEISSFNRCFAQHIGMSPSHYRRCYHGAEIPASTGGRLTTGLRAYDDSEN